MKITIAKNSGFCFGVKRAVDIVEKLSAGRDKIYTNGPIIHNPQVIRTLSKRGVKTLNSSDDALRLKSGLLVIRTHGMKKDFPAAVSKKVRIIDATCPFVGRAQKIVKKLAAEGRKVIILGDAHHPEVEGLVSYAEKAAVIKTPSGASKLDLRGRIGFLSQTTQSVGDFAAIARYIKKRNPTALIFDTICRTTSLRQSEVEKLARKSDIMVVVGGNNSANTKRLADISRKHTVTYHIETSSELKKSWFVGKGLSVGISAGASTPDRITRKVAERIKKISASR